MSGRGIDQILPYPCDPTLHESYVRDARQYVALAERRSGVISSPVNFDYVWGDARELLDREAPDFRFVNLETAITCSGDYWPDKGIYYRMHPANGPCLAHLKLNACALANNHLLDWGYAGLTDSLATLRRLGIASSGAGENWDRAAAPAVLNSGATRLLIFSVGLPSSGIAADWAAGPGQAGVFRLPDLSPNSLNVLLSQIARYRRAGDCVVVSVHWGGNWGYQIMPDQRQFARALVDGGVHLVHGHSTHHPIGMERYRGHLICYGCGDFINDYEGIRGYEAFRDHISLVYLLSVNSEGQMTALRIIPMQIKRLQLRYADEEDARWITRICNRESVGLEFELDDGRAEGPGPPFWMSAV